MKKFLFVLLVIPVMASAQKAGFTIDGKLDGYADNTEVKLFENGGQVPLATGKIIKTKFILNGVIEEPMLCLLTIGDEQAANTGRPIEIYVENKPISLKGSKATPGQSKIEGSASHAEFENFLKDFLPVAQSINSTSSTLNYTMAGAARDSMMNVYTSLQNKLQQVIDKQVSSKPNSYVTAFLLTATSGFADDVIMLEERYTKLSETIKKSKAGNNLNNLIAEKKVGAIGTLAADFTQPDPAGTPVSLSSFKGKYVLLDFWASWCGPCRMENPTVVENYNKFKAKNFTVLGVSLDRPGQKDKWISAIKEDGLTWTQISDLQGWSNSAALLYKVQGIPQNFLIDPSGKIIAKNLRGPSLRDKLCEVLGCN